MAIPCLYFLWSLFLQLLRKPYFFLIEENRIIIHDKSGLREYNLNDAEKYKAVKIEYTRRGFDFITYVIKEKTSQQNDYVTLCQESAFGDLRFLHDLMLNLAEINLFSNQLSSFESEFEQQSLYFNDFCVNLNLRVLKSEKLQHEGFYCENLFYSGQSDSYKYYIKVKLFCSNEKSQTTRLKFGTRSMIVFKNNSDLKFSIQNSQMLPKPSRKYQNSFKLNKNFILLGTRKIYNKIKSLNFNSFKWLNLYQKNGYLFLTDDFYEYERARRKVNNGRSHQHDNFVLGEHPIWKSQETERSLSRYLELMNDISQSL